MVSHTRYLSRFGAAVAAFVCAISLAAQTALALEISFRSFSGSAAIGPPADEYAAKLLNISTAALGKTGQVKFTKYAPTPAIPKGFKDIAAAVGAGGPLAGGTGFDAAYISGLELSPAWGFMYNSGVPFGPNFDEFIGFLYGKSIDDGTASGLDLLQRILDNSGKNVVVVPIVGSSHQGSGYFMLPVGNELIALAKDMRDASARGEALELSEDELAFYDALETNDSAVKVLGEPTLKAIARELVATVKKNVTIDWTIRENVRAQLRVVVKRILRKYGYPPDKQEKATQTVLEQAEVLSQEWAVA